jgi:hypothetical protein
MIILGCDNARQMFAHWKLQVSGGDFGNFCVLSMVFGAQPADDAVELIQICKGDNELSLVARAKLDKYRRGQRIGQLFFQAGDVA